MHRKQTKRRLETQLDGLKSKLEFYNREITTLNATMSAEVKTAINDWFGKEQENTFLSVIGNYLSTAVDALSYFVGQIGLSTDDASHMKEVVRLMEQEKKAQKEDRELGKQYEEVKDLSGNEEVLEHMQSCKSCIVFSKINCSTNEYKPKTEKNFTLLGKMLASLETSTCHA